MQDGFDDLKEDLEDQRLDPALRAQALQFIQQLAQGSEVDLYRRHAATQETYVSFEAKLCLVKIRDQAMLAQLRLDLASEFGADRRTAIALSVASGHEDLLQAIIDQEKSLSSEEAKVALGALKRGKAVNADALLNKLALREDEVGLEAIKAFIDLGEEAIDDIVALFPLMATRSRPEYFNMLAESLAKIPVQRSREELMKLEVGRNRERFLVLRTLVRYLDLSLLKN